MTGVTEWIVGGGLLAIFGAMIHNNRSNDSKVSRVYKRLDEVKDQHDVKYVSQAICSVLHKQIKDDVFEIKKDVKELLKRNGG